MEIQNLTLYQGKTWDIDITITMPIGEDLTGYAVRSHARKHLRDVAPAFSFIGVVKDAEGKIANLHKTAADSATVTPADYLYDVEIYKEVDGEMIVHAPTSGKITVKAEVTKI